MLCAVSGLCLCRFASTSVRAAPELAPAVRLCRYLLSEGGQQQMHYYCHNGLSGREELATSC